MGKKSKAEKLKQILSELQKLRSEVKSLGKQHASLLAQAGKNSTRKPAAKPAARKPAKKASAAPQAAKKAIAPKRPVLVSPADAGTPAAKAAGH